jgi:trigger factor
LKIETKDLEDRQIQLTVEVPEDRVEAAKRSAARQLGKRIRVPGFRPGKAPYKVLLSRIGEKEIFEEALENLGQEVYRQALETSELDPYGPGTLEEIVSDHPLVLRFSVPLAPEVDLGPYREVRLPYEQPEVEDEEVNKVMERLREQQALIEPVDRPAEDSDLVVIDVFGELQEEDGEHETTLLDEKSVSVLVDEETDWPVPGIADHLMGMESGQEASFEYTFPEDYPTEDMRGKKATFQITCQEVKSRHVPEWSDDLARSIGDFDDLLNLRIQVRKDLTAESERQAEAMHARQVVEAVVEGATITYPPMLLEEEQSNMLRDLERRLRLQNLSLEDYLKIEKKTKEEFIEELEPQARERLKRALVLGKVVEVEELEVAGKEIDDEVEKIVSQLGDTSEKTKQLFDNPSGRREIEIDKLTEKAIQYLVAIAKDEVEEIEKTPVDTQGKDEDPIPETPIEEEE